MVSKALIVASYRHKLTELARLGVEVTAMVPPGWRENGVWQALEEDRRVAPYRLLVSSLRFNGHYHLHSYPEVGAMLDEVKPDLVHVDEEPYNLATFLAVRAASRRGIPAVFFTWQNIFKRYPPPFGWMETDVFRRAGAMAGNMEAGEILRRKGFAGPVAVVPQFGVDTEMFAPNPAPHAEFRVGLLNRLIPAKGTQVMLAALRHLPSDVEVVIVGDGPQRDEIEREVVREGWQQRVSLRSRVPSTAIPDLMNTLDVVVLPSLTTPSWKEQFGRVLIEAMAAGVPVVGSDSGEIPHVIGDAGLVVPEGNAEALAGAIRTLYEDPKGRGELGRRGRARAVGTFSHGAVAAGSLALYRRMTGQDVDRGSAWSTGGDRANASPW